MTNLSQLSLEALYSRLEELNAEWHEVEREIAAKQMEEKRQLADEIKTRILAAGHDVGEISNLLVPRKRRVGKAASAYTRYVDPDNSANSYTRGVLPAWFKAGMEAKGLDPSSKQDRESYKQKYLKTVSG